MDFKNLKVLSLISLLTIGTPALAKEVDSTLPHPRKVMKQSEYRPHVGLSYGLLFPEGSYNSNDVIGLDVGFQPFIPYGLGMEFVTTNIKNDSDYHLNRNDVTVKGTYNFGGDTAILKHSFVGLGLGASFDGSGSEMLATPLLGFDCPLAHKPGEGYFSLGAGAKYSIYGGDQPDTFALNALIKYWF